MVLIGAPGAGKTRTGKRVARLLGAAFIDTDKRIVDEHGPISALFQQHGEPHFRAIERAVVARALREPAVVTLGAGAVIDPLTQADLSRKRVVQLTISPDAVAARLTGTKRPLVADGLSAWTALVEARQPVYDRLSQITVDTSSQPLELVAEKIADWVRGQR